MAMLHIAGNAALDFVGTVSERGTADEEGLTDGAALARWYVEAGLVDRPPKVDATHLAEARRLREHLHDLVCALVEGTPLPERSRSSLNRVARRPGTVQTIGPDARRVRRGDAGACLAAVAQAGVELFDRTDGAVVRFCADDRCTHPFLDRSRSKLRRWCDMDTCGDRAKVRRYRGKASA
ncbi:ABATE domain-containing protein [Terrabacter sp. MAHUQ-38]|jgi:predicted RNA-binding Zn ribbon-like protein|uniref:CGNR zinc finger domain-containing protein n=1 Tax=unclassified Terrabacter TaxID=2630222 RepID=UPI00165D5A2F|nr:ABATE domain-containing protein [Terrabacter sp. MAHUQ-38]MBC9820439.1 ABATE domain-containing protein [Terrabacter sp. MAHUQ-38]